MLIVYFAVLVVITPLLWFILPETKGKSLEEIGLIFGDRQTHTDLEAIETTKDKDGVHIDEKKMDASAVKESQHVEG